MTSTKSSIVFVLFCLIIPTIACVSSTTEPAEQSSANSSSTKLATATSAPAADTDTPTPEPTPTSAPTYGEPVLLLESEAVGENVSDNFELPACQKAVFDYSVSASEHGMSSLILKLNKIGEDRDVGLINGFTEGEMAGQVLQPLTGGEYFFSSENTDEPWKIRVECQDNTAPVAEGVDIQGVGPTVTSNYRLPQCSKSVFLWEADMNNSGSASIIARIYLTNVDEQKRETLANEFSTDSAVSGETLQQIGEGDYFFTVENTDEPWRIRWECRD